MSTANQLFTRLMRSTTSKRTAVAVIIPVVATALILPIFVYGFPMVGDAGKQYRWSTDFYNALHEGAIYPRWFPDTNHGMGSALPIYYPPLPFYVASAFNLVSPSMLFAVSLACWVALLLSGFIMYRLGRLTLSRGASLLAALLYMIIPYHILDLYQGAALSEYWCFAWAPLLLYTSYRAVSESGVRTVAYLGISYALLLQTHVPSSLLMSLTLPVWALALTRDWRRLTRVVAGLAFGAALSAIFVVPVIFERKYIQIDRVLARCDYRQYFTLEHLGTAFKGLLFPAAADYYVLQTDMATLGLLLLLVTTGLFLYQKAPGWWMDSRTSILPAVFIITVLSLFLSTRLSRPLWRTIPDLPFLLFPFRWLIVTSVGASLLVGAAVSPPRGFNKFRIALVFAIGIVVLFDVTVSLLAIDRAPHDQQLLGKRLLRKETPEYRTAWWIGETPAELQMNPVVVANGDALITKTHEHGTTQTFEVVASAHSLIGVRTLYFPGWKARVDGQPVEIAPGYAGNIQINVEPGEHSVTLDFEDTWPRRLGKIVSIASLAMLVVVASISRFRTHKDNQAR